MKNLGTGGMHGKIGCFFNKKNSGKNYVFKNKNKNNPNFQRVFCMGKAKKWGGVMAQLEA